MAERFSLKETFHFDAPGTLTRPGPIGRLIRLGLGALCLSLVFDLVTQSMLPDLSTVSRWLFIGVGLVLVPYVFNIGFGVSAGGWPRYLSVTLLLLAAMTSFFSSGSLLESPLPLTVMLWMTYVYGHLGFSFLLSSILATPGCEMRAIPHLLGMARGQEAAEHYCPGFIDDIDRWEAARNSTGVEAIASDADDPRSKDLLNSAGQYLLFYGVPFGAAQLAGNLGGFEVATRVPALAFFVIAVVCFINIRRSRRVHCYLIAPLFLAMSIGLGLYSIDLLNFGSSTWSLIVNGGLIAGICLSFHMEAFWGKYFQKA